MGPIQDGFEAWLRDNDIVYFKSLRDNLVVPQSFPDGTILTHVNIDEDIPEACFMAELCEILPQMHAAVARHVGEKVGIKLKHIKWGLEDGRVQVATNSDLHDVTDTTAALSRSLVRISLAIEEHREGILDLALGKRVVPPSRMEKELDEIIRETSSQAKEPPATQSKRLYIDAPFLEQLAGGQTITVPCQNGHERGCLLHELDQLAADLGLQLELHWKGAELTIRAA